MEFGETYGTEWNLPLGQFRSHFMFPFLSHHFQSQKTLVKTGV